MRSTNAEQVTRLEQLRELHDMHERLGNHDAAFDARARARKYCESRLAELPAWAAPRKRGGDGPRPPRKAAPTPVPAPIAPLTSTVAEHLPAPIECPRYESLRAWARAQSGSRVICWHAEGKVSIVWIVTDTDRRRSQTFESEQIALDAIAAGTVKWGQPRRLTPKLTSGGRPRLH
jgi:hypothetical protein